MTITANRAQTTWGRAQCTTQRTTWRGRAAHTTTWGRRSTTTWGSPA
ncbi:MAG TPA: hypothetical protein VHV09_04140 [Trebonia sp.]|jgi:hypothetical protein|nr:hypothetical protein [Trebonia sp.]